MAVRGQHRSQRDQRMVKCCLTCLIPVSECDGGVGSNKECRHFRLWGKSNEIPIVQHTSGRREVADDVSWKAVDRAASRTLKKMEPKHLRPRTWMRLSQQEEQEA